jgi:hypothetical protein
MLHRYTCQPCTGGTVSISDQCFSPLVKSDNNIVVHMAIKVLMAMLQYSTTPIGLQGGAAAILS